MRYFFILFLFITVSNAQIIQKFTDPNTCKTCHEEQFKDWGTSLHSKSHVDNNELYKEVVKLVSREARQPYENVLVKCGDCHNPRLEVTPDELDENYILAKAFSVETSKTKKIDNAVKATHIQNGISCYVCHNVDSISTKNDNKDVGYKVFKWIKDDTIVGPFDDSSNRAVFHKSELREHFITGDSLCLACHQGEAADNKLSIYNTGEETAQNGNQKRCVECHMSDARQEIIAPNIRPEKGVKRLVRSHLFKGIRNDSALLKKYINLSFKITKPNQGVIEIENLATHNLPSGFSGRSIVLSIKFLGENGELSSDILNFEKVYLSKIKTQTLSYIATELASDSTLKALEKRDILINLPQGTRSVKMELNYYVLSPKLQNIMDIKNEVYKKPYPIKSLDFKVN